MSKVSKLDEIIFHLYMANDCNDKTTNHAELIDRNKQLSKAKSQIQSLIKEAVPEKLPRDSNEFGQPFITGRNTTIIELETNLIKQGLIETNKERKK